MRQPKAPAKQPAIDVEADIGKAASPDEIKAIVDLAREMYKLGLQIEADTLDLQKKAERFNTLQLITLPERMKSAGMKSFSLENGYEVEIKDVISASMPSRTAIEDEKDPLRKVELQKRRAACMAWLKKQKGEALIKNKLTAEFGKGEGDAAKAFEKRIRKDGFQVKLDESVHPQTLGAFIREKIQAGVDVPVGPFGLFVGQKASITQKQKK